MKLSDRIVQDGLTYDDVLLLPARSAVLPSETDLDTSLSRNIRLTIPLVSAAMDTVTESRLAVALAQEGGIGIVHRNMTIEHQVHEVRAVKRSANGVIRNPVVLPPDAMTGTAKQTMREHGVHGIPVVDTDGRVVGILTGRDLRFQVKDDVPVRDVMTRNLVTAGAHTTLDEAKVLLHQHKVEKLILVDERGRLAGLITMKDIRNVEEYPRAARDGQGRLLVGAAVGAGDVQRAEALAAAGVDCLVLDSAHGHSEGVIRTLRELKARTRVDVIAGNVATARGALDLVEAGADAVKVGIGPGSICTTRVVSGVGGPQLTAVADCAGAVQGRVPIIADGGVRKSGDITKALAAGASTVMLGGLFAGLEENPGEVIHIGGRSFKVYRGMGSLGAMEAGSAGRYFQEGRPRAKLVPEGVEGRVPLRGTVSSMVYQLAGGVRSGLGYCGCRTIPELQERGRFVKISPAGLAESHPHSIEITRDSSDLGVS